MSTNNSNKHLTDVERSIIETGIKNGSTQTAIAKILGKNKSTIGREIKEHRELKSACKLPVECAIYAKCKPGIYCKETKCENFVQFTCTRRDRSPGACNGCEKYNSCRYNKLWYNAIKAQHQYKETLSDSRAGANLTTSEARAIAEIIKPLLENGLSLYQIVQNHPELKISERTLYTYLEEGTLSQFGVTNMDLRRQVSRRPSKKKANEYRKRNDYRYLQGRKYEDYKEFIEFNPDIPVVQMDTVYNNGTTGPFIQTFKFMLYRFMFAVLHAAKDGESMVRGVDLLYRILGPELFRREVGILLTDRGSEFTLADRFENDDQGHSRTRVFYCDPMASCQKGSLENNHIELRYILPKETDLRALGLTSQEKLNLVISHVNSGAKEYLNGKAPLDVLQFLAPDVYQKFIDFGVEHIEKDAVILAPHLLK